MIFVWSVYEQPSGNLFFVVIDHIIFITIIITHSLKTNPLDSSLESPGFRGDCLVILNLCSIQADLQSLLVELDSIFDAIQFAINAAQFFVCIQSSVFPENVLFGCWVGGLSSMCCYFQYLYAQKMGHNFSIQRNI